MHRKANLRTMSGMAIRLGTRSWMTVLTCWCLSPMSAAADDNSASDPIQNTNITRKHWSQWRGPLSTGQGIDADPPIEWSEQRNIRWKRRIPGQGHSTPIVWGDRVFVTAAVPFGERLTPKRDRAPGIT